MMLFWLFPIVYLVVGSVVGKVYFNREARRNRKYIGETTSIGWDGYNHVKADKYDDAMSTARGEAWLLVVFWLLVLVVGVAGNVGIWLFGSKQHRLNKITQKELNELKKIKKRTPEQQRRLEDIEMELGKC